MIELLACCEPMEEQEDILIGHIIIADETADLILYSERRPYVNWGDFYKNMFRQIDKYVSDNQNLKFTVNKEYVAVTGRL